MAALSILDLVRVTQATDARGALDNARDLAAHAEKLGLPPLLGRRASQHAGHRQRRDVGRHRPYRRGHEDHPGRRRRDHAAEPCALCHRRAVRHAGAALSRPHRPRARPRAGNRPAHAARVAPHARAAETLSAGRARAAGILRPAGPASASRRCRRREPRCRCGSSGRAHFGAMLAAELGLPYAFASHFAPELLMPALQIYRSRFKPSEQLDRPYAMVGVNIIAADTRRRGAPPGDDAADVDRQHLPRRARA